MAVFYNRATLVFNGQSLNSNQVSGEVTPSVSLTKTAISSSYSLGDAVAYVISIVNSGTTSINNLSLTDDLGVYTLGNTAVVPLTYREGSILYYIDGVLQPAPRVSTGTGLFISGIDIPAGSNAIIIYEATANSYAPLEAGSEITNRVTACSGCGNLSDSATVSVNEAADLSITKTISPEVITDCLVNYSFIIQNSGNLPVNGDGDLIVTDIFDPILNDLDVTLNGKDLEAGTGYTYNEATGEFSTLPGVITVDAASFTQDPITGLITINPGVSILTVSGRLGCTGNL
jgi:uncharacterized repeat protein (TIGR01451 family)